ncbi:MAG: alpha/beta hydrolase [Bacillaceae bacterium]|nr:alpha/beta hydrolase [Bacillaceae bacterium]
MRKTALQKMINHLRNKTDRLDMKTPTDQTNELKRYLEFYELPVEDGSYYFGNLHVGSYTIKVQMFEASQLMKKRDIILLLHGYLDHVGILSSTIRFLTNEGYSVVTFDWPGHGLSSGKQAEINHFEEYQQVYETVLREIKEQCGCIPHVIAHSTGAAVVINDLLTSNQQKCKSIILVAPLIRSNMWTITTFGYYFMKPVLKRVKRVVRESSGDEQFVQFLKNDPFQSSTVPLKWLKALIDWNAEVHAMKEKEHRILVLQGVKDETVDWKYNCQFIARLFYDSEVILFDEGRHHLLNEVKGIRSNVYEKILDELK